MTTRNSTTTQPATQPSIRAEVAGDTTGIRRVLAAAFRNETEADLVEALRNNGALTISLVACAANEIVGHIAFSPMHSDGQPDRDDVFGLAPLAVHPQWQRRGVGSALIRRGLDECRNRAIVAVFVLGESGSYTRFGFIPAHTRGFRSVYEAPPDAFQILLLSNTLIAPSAGLIRYRPEFDSLP